MNNNDQWRLLSKSLAGETSVGEMLEVQAMLNSDPALKEWYDALTGFWQQPAIKDNEVGERAFEKIWKRI